MLVKRAGHVLSRDAIMDQLKGHDWAANDRAIDSQISRLRRKLGGENFRSNEPDQDHQRCRLQLHGQGDKILVQQEHWFDQSS